MDQEEKPQWEYKPDNGPATREQAGGSAKAAAPKRHNGSFSWEAPEFIGHDHGAGWYAVLATITLALAAVVYLAAKDTFATVIIALLGIIVGVFAAQKPGQAKYEVSNEGLSINGKLYGYGSYKSFALIDEGDLYSVNLLPLKRFMPPLSAYFEPKDEKKITEILGDYLAYEDRKLDGVERLARRLRL